MLNNTNEQSRFEQLSGNKMIMAAAMVNKYWDTDKHKYDGYVFIQDQENVYHKWEDAVEAAAAWLSTNVPGAPAAEPKESNNRRAFLSRVVDFMVRA